MPKPDPESGLLVDALAALGVPATIRVWDQPYDWERASLVVCRTPWDYVLRADEFLGWARRVAAVTTLLNPFEILRWNAHKAYLGDLARAGVRTVPTVLVPRGASSGEQTAALTRYPELVIKPAVSAGAHRALRTRAGERAAAEHLRSLVADGDALVQPFVTTVAQDGESSLIYFDGRFSHAVRKLPRPGEYRVQERYGGTVVSHQPTPAELSTAAAALAAAPGNTAYARIDTVPDSDGPLLMEAELIEPELFLPMHPDAARRFAAGLAARLSG